MAGRADPPDRFGAAVVAGDDAVAGQRVERLGEAVDGSEV